MSSTQIKINFRKLQSLCERLSLTN